MKTNILFVIIFLCSINIFGQQRYGIVDTFNYKILKIGQDTMLVKDQYFKEIGEIPDFPEFIDLLDGWGHGNLIKAWIQDSIVVKSETKIIYSKNLSSRQKQQTIVSLVKKENKIVEVKSGPIAYPFELAWEFYVILLASALPIFFWKGILKLRAKKLFRMSFFFLIYIIPAFFATIFVVNNGIDLIGLILVLFVFCIAALSLYPFYMTNWACFTGIAFALCWMNQTWYQLIIYLSVSVAAFLFGYLLEDRKNKKNLKTEER